MIIKISSMTSKEVEQFLNEQPRGAVSMQYTDGIRGPYQDNTTLLRVNKVDRTVGRMIVKTGVFVCEGEIPEMPRINDVMSVEWYDCSYHVGSHSRPRSSYLSIGRNTSSEDFFAFEMMEVGAVLNGISVFDALVEARKKVALDVQEFSAKAFNNRSSFCLDQMSTSKMGSQVNKANACQFFALAFEESREFLGLQKSAFRYYPEQLSPGAFYGYAPHTNVMTGQYLAIKVLWRNTLLGRFLNSINL